MWRSARIWKKQALHVSDTCLSKDIFESRKTPRFLIDVWSLIGEPATETVPIDSAKAARGLDSGVVKGDGLWLGWVQVKTIIQKPVVNSLSARFNWSNLSSQRWRVSTLYKAECHQHIDGRTLCYFGLTDQDLLHLRLAILKRTKSSGVTKAYETWPLTIDQSRCSISTYMWSAFIFPCFPFHIRWLVTMALYACALRLGDFWGWQMSSRLAAKHCARAKRSRISDTHRLRSSLVQFC